MGSYTIAAEVTDETGLAGSSSVLVPVKTPPSAGSVSGGQIRGVLGVGWDKLAITYNTRPGIEKAVLYTAWPLKPRDVVGSNVMAAMTAAGVYGFFVVSTLADPTVYRSREAGSGGPRLVVTFGSEWGD